MTHPNRIKAVIQNETRESTMLGNNKTISTTAAPAKSATLAARSKSATFAARSKSANPVTRVKSAILVIPEKLKALSGIHKATRLAALLAAAWLTLPGAALAQDACDDAIFPSEMTCTPDGNAVILDNDDSAGGEIDLSAVSGGYTLNNNAGATWNPSVFGSNSSDFLTFDVIQVADLGEGVLNNAGTIQLRQGNFISASGTTFNGAGDSFLSMNTLLNGTGQSNCSAPTIAGCLDLTGGATSGQTRIGINLSPQTFNATFPTPARPNAGIVLVDVSGGTSAADHFVLNPGASRVSEDPFYGLIIDLDGLFDYTLLYNAGTQQHVLASVPQGEALEYAFLMHESLSMWHTTADAVAGRQADLRDGATGNFWVRAGSDWIDRDNAAPTFTTQGNTFTYDRSYSIENQSLLFGFDAISEDDRVLGVYGGLVKADTKYNDSSTHDDTLGGAFGGYAGWWSDSGLSVDAALNLNAMQIDHAVADFEDNYINVMSLGLRAEAGWRVLLNDGLYVQPLVTGSYVKVDIENLDLRGGNNLRYEDVDSMRAAVGARLGGGMSLRGERFSELKYRLTARIWKESADEARVEFTTDAAPLAIVDDMSGSFEEVVFGVSLTNKEGNMSIFLSGGAEFSDEMGERQNVTLGARWSW